jgi:hypothetical protein
MKMSLFRKPINIALTLATVMILGGCCNQIKSSDGSINFPYDPADLGGHSITILAASRQLEGMGIAVAAFPLLPHQTNSYKAKISNKIAALNLTNNSLNNYHVELTIVGAHKIFYITGIARSSSGGKIEMKNANINGIKKTSCRMIFFPINRLIHPLVRLHDGGCPYIDATNEKLDGIFG